MKKTLSLGHTLHILYIEKDPADGFNKTILSLVSKHVCSSHIVDDAIDQYLQFYKKYSYYFDIVIMDNDYGLNLLNIILDINPSQKFIINVKQDSTKNISSFYMHDITELIHEPLTMESVNKCILKVIAKNDNNNFLLRNMEEYGRLDKETSSVIRKYETKIIEMEHKLKSQSDFFASMSHEIRTPMNSIIGMSQILLDDKALGKKQLQTAKTINNSSNMLVGIINDILDFSKIEAGMLSLENITFNINSILDYLADTMSLKIKEKGIDLIFDIHKNVEKNFIGDPLRLSQILLNLISNAVKFTEDGSILLKITTLENNSYMQFEVKDTGIGIKKERLDSLFENYTQADEDTSRKYGGTGLGLSISKQLTELMDGSIWAESEYGDGTSFFVKVKLQKDTLGTKRSYRLPTKSLMNKKVMVFDSRNVSLNAIKPMLEYFHFDVTNVLTVEQARKNLVFNIYDILFIDKELFKLCKLDELKLQSVPHIIIMEDWIDTMHRTETDDEYKYLKRPYTQQMIFETILDTYNYELPSELKKEATYTKEDLSKLGKHKILLAEDNPINQAVITGLLLDTDIEVVCTNNGEEVLHELYHSEYEYKLILMDINMPKLNGYKATQKIRQNSKYDELIIVALSGDTSSEDIKKAKEVGMQEYLTKPIDVKNFYKVLCNSLFI